MMLGDALQSLDGMVRRARAPQPRGPISSRG